MTTTELANSFPCSKKNKTASSNKVKTESHQDDIDCRRVVQRFHSIFTSGALHCLEAEGFYFLDSNFTMISPQGHAVSRSKFVEQLQQQKPNKDTEIHIHDFKVIHQNQDNTQSSTVLCSYQEWRRKKENDSLVVTARQCTALLRKVKQKLLSQQELDVREKEIPSAVRWEWIHMHQTWLEGMGPGQNQTQQTIASTKLTRVAANEVSVPSTSIIKAAAKSELLSFLVSPRRFLAVESIWPVSAKPIMMGKMVVGIEYLGMRVLTTQGPKANRAWLEQTARRLQPYCQPLHISSQYRQLVLPQSCFDQAAITIQLLGRFNGTTLSWTAWQALVEWSRGHQYISTTINNQSCDFGPDSTASSYDSVVSILNADKSTTISNIKETDSNYDWTFSTPFSCHLSSSYFYWKPLQRNGIDICSLMQSRDEPIIYYDEIDLYEDHLHEIGIVTCRAKIRITPTYLYLLFRLMARVDQISILVRDTRVLYDGEDVFRTVTWRRSDWKDLSNNCCSEWRKAFESREGPDEDLISKLPMVNLPEHMPKYSKLDCRRKGVKSKKIK